MARIAGVPEHAAGGLTRLIYRFARRMLHKLPEPLAVHAHDPWVLRAYTAYEFALGRADALDKRLKTLAGIKAAALIGCPF